MCPHALFSQARSHLIIASLQKDLISMLKNCFLVKKWQGPAKVSNLANQIYHTSVTVLVQKYTECGLGPHFFINWALKFNVMHNFYAVVQGKLILFSNCIVFFQLSGNCFIIECQSELIGLILLSLLSVA